MPILAGFTVYGGFVILCGIELVWRAFFAPRREPQHVLDRTV
jgi:hypothetical protein